VSYSINTGKTNISVSYRINQLCCILKN